MFLGLNKANKKYMAFMGHLEKIISETSMVKTQDKTLDSRLSNDY